MATSVAIRHVLRMSSSKAVEDTAPPHLLLLGSDAVQVVGDVLDEDPGDAGSVEGVQPDDVIFPSDLPLTS